MTVLYFAWVRQKTGIGAETLALPAGISTVAELAEFLTRRGGGWQEAFADPNRLRVAVNQVHGTFASTLKDGDEVAFFPPVTGG